MNGHFLLRGRNGTTELAWDMDRPGNYALPFRWPASSDYTGESRNVAHKSELSDPELTSAPGLNMARIPSIDNQLEQAKAPKGSALEKTIRENQNFELLAPEELADDYPIPLWLRVAWRKQHPEIPMPAKNPGAAYPEVLSQIYKRMVANPLVHWGPGAASVNPLPSHEK